MRAPLDLLRAAGLRSPFTLAVTRVMGLAVWAIAVVPAVVLIVAPPAHGPAHPTWQRLLWLLPIAAFGPLYWWNARRIQGPSPSRASLVVLGLQAVFALASLSDLVILVAIEIPFVLVGRRALWAVIGLMAASAARAVATHGQTYLGPLPWLPDLPFQVVFGLTLLTNTMWQALGFSAGYLVANQHRNVEELARVNAELVATQQLLGETSRLAERLHISRELHDAVGHHLAALSLNLELAARRAEGPAAASIAEAHAVARLLLAEIRDMVGSLRQQRPLDLRRALGTLAGGTRAPRVLLALPDALELADPSHAHAVFRCVQEAITNAVRHAGARHLWVELAQEPGRLSLRIHDDGRGAEAPRPGNGLTGMRERFEEAGGGLTVDAAPGRGFEIRGWLPAPGEGT